jgi:hypothetical protein
VRKVKMYKEKRSAFFSRARGRMLSPKRWKKADCSQIS